MEALKIKLNNVKRFDEIIKASLPEDGDMEIITKDAGMVTGRGIVMVTFTVRLPDGTKARAQSVTSLRMFKSMADAINATYDNDGFRVNMADPLDDGVIDNG